jgi:isopentenyl-diphosphate Delta-isomerase
LRTRHRDLDGKESSDTMTEMVDIVDEDDNVVGRTSWEEAFRNNLLRRNVRIFILNSKGEILLQKRSIKLKIHPGQWSCSATGAVSSGERYQDAAERELKEEMRIETELEFLFKMRQYNPNAISAVFEGHYDGEARPNSEEVERIELASIGKIIEEIENGTRDFSDSFKKSFKKYVEFKSN